MSVTTQSSAIEVTKQGTARVSTSPSPSWREREGEKKEGLGLGDVSYRLCVYLSKYIPTPRVDQPLGGSKEAVFV